MERVRCDHNSQGECIMPLRIMALKNYLPLSKKPYYIRAQITEVIDEEKLIDNMAKGRTTLTRTDIVACMQLFHEEVLKQLTSGYKVRTRLGTLYAGVSGALDSREQPFTPNEAETGHSINVYFQIDRKLEK